MHLHEAFYIQILAIANANQNSLMLQQGCFSDHVKTNNQTAFMALLMDSSSAKNLF